MLATVAILFSTFWAYGQYGGGLIYFSDGENKFAQVNLRARGNLSVDETNDLLSEVENRILGVEGIAHANAFTVISGQPSRSGGTDRIGSVFWSFMTALTGATTPILCWTRCASALRTWSALR